jgi:hypothetical protein
MGENPVINGPGWDFGVMWEVGRAILAGQDPYTVFGSFYPPAMSYLFVLFALLPLGLAYGLWTAANIGFLLRAVGLRRMMAWLLFVPMFMVIAAGQVDAAFLALATFLPKRDWKSVAAAALITLKPQVALLLLPLFLVRWLLTDRRRLAAFVGATAVLHLWPLALDPTIGSRWIERLTSSVGYRQMASPGLWSVVSEPKWLIGLLAMAIIIGALMTRREWVSRAANVLALPVGFFYDTVVLTGSTPARLLVPVSWLALGLAHFANAYWPFALIPAAALVWNLRGLRVHLFLRTTDSIAIAGRWAFGQSGLITPWVTAPQTFLLTPWFSLMVTG